MNPQTMGKSLRNCGLSYCQLLILAIILGLISCGYLWISLFIKNELIKKQACIKNELTIKLILLI